MEYRKKSNLIKDAPLSQKTTGNFVKAEIKKLNIVHPGNIWETEQYNEQSRH